MLNAFRESLARIVELMIGVAAGVFLVGQLADPPRTEFSSLGVVVVIAGVTVVGAGLAAAIHTSRIGRPPAA